MIVKSIVHWRRGLIMRPAANAREVDQDTSFQFPILRIAKTSLTPQGRYKTSQRVNDDTASTVLLPLVRRALDLRDIDAARAHFVELPSLETRHAEWLEASVRNGYETGRFDISAVISFFESLPNWHWTLEGCELLHRINATDGSARVRAEAYWHECVAPIMRATVTGQPVLIESLARHEIMYAPIDGYAYDASRRNVFTWSVQWTGGERKDQWRILPVSDARNLFYLQSVKFGEYLYAADYAKPGHDERGKSRSRVFTWRKKSENVGEMGHWQLIPVDPQAPDVFAVYNPYQKEYLYSPRDTYDQQRRYVWTVAPTANDSTWEQERRWRITLFGSPSMGSG